VILHEYVNSKSLNDYVLDFEGNELSHKRAFASDGLLGWKD
jgi:hypothetical protein